MHVQSNITQFVFEIKKRAQLKLSDLLVFSDLFDIPLSSPIFSNRRSTWLCCWLRISRSGAVSAFRFQFCSNDGQTSNRYKTEAKAASRERCRGGVYFRDCLWVTRKSFPAAKWVWRRTQTWLKLKKLIFKLCCFCAFKQVLPSAKGPIYPRLRISLA